MMTLKEKFIEIEEKGHTRKKDEYRDGTVNGFLELVDRIVNHAIDVLKVVVENKAKPSKFLAPRYWRKRSLKDFEEKVLETITDQDLRDAWKFDLQTGLRSSALCGLTWDRVDLKERLITVPLKAKGKSVKPHQVYVSDEALGILLRRYGQHPKWVFTMIAQRESVVERVRRRAGERIPLKSGTFSKRMKEAFEKAKIEDFVVHDLRHTAAYRLWRDTSDIELVRVFLGHADVSQTRRYINVSAEDVAFAIRKKAERAGKRKKAKAGGRGRVAGLIVRADENTLRRIHRGPWMAAEERPARALAKKCRLLKDYGGPALQSEDLGRPACCTTRTGPYCRGFPRVVIGHG
jgi:integrase